MDIDKIQKYLENQFVEDYEIIKQFMDDVNETLTNLDIENYLSYNEFCLDIEKAVLDSVEESDEQNLYPQLIVGALNDMLKYKIIEDVNYEDKIRNYFDDPELVLDDINRLKLKNLKKN